MIARSTGAGRPRHGLHARSRLILGTGAVIVGIVALDVACSVETGGSDGFGDPPDTGVVPREASTPPDAGSDARTDLREPKVSVYAGFETTCTIQANGTTQCWGDDSYADLGRGDWGAATPIASVIGGLTAKKMAGGYRFQCATTSAGDLGCWGFNQQGQLGRSPLSDDDAGRCVGGAPCGRSPKPVPGTSGIVDVSGGSGFACGVIEDEVSCWGTGSLGEIGAVDSGATFSYSPNAVGLTDVDAIASGFTFSCAHKTDGTVWCWGRRQLGEIGRPEGTVDPKPWDNVAHPVPTKVPLSSKALSVTTGVHHACVVHEDKTVSCWGLNARAPNPGGQLGHSSSLDQECFRPTEDLPIPSCTDTPTQVAGLANVRELALGVWHSCALLEDDSVVCWGQNDLGRLGHDPAEDGAGTGDAGSATAVFTPKPVKGLVNVAHISSRWQHTCAVTWDSKVYCWGNNGSHALGAYEGASSFTPVEVQGL